jgi:hypothetical protein
MSGNNGKAPEAPGGWTPKELDEFMCRGAVPELARPWTLKLATVLVAEMALLHKAAVEGRLSHSRSVATVMGHAAHLRALNDPRLRPQIAAFQKAWWDLAAEHAGIAGTEFASSSSVSYSSSESSQDTSPKPNPKELERSPSPKPNTNPKDHQDLATANSLEGADAEDPFSGPSGVSRSDSCSDSASDSSSRSGSDSCSASDSAQDSSSSDSDSRGA